MAGMEGTSGKTNSCIVDRVLKREIRFCDGTIHNAASVIHLQVKEDSDKCDIGQTHFGHGFPGSPGGQE
jgi:hypothetical protein